MRPMHAGAMSARGSRNQRHSGCHDASGKDSGDGQTQNEAEVIGSRRTAEEEAQGPVLGRPPQDQAAAKPVVEPVLSQLRKHKAMLEEITAALSVQFTRTAASAGRQADRHHQQEARPKTTIPSDRAMRRSTTPTTARLALAVPLRLPP